MNTDRCPHGEDAVAFVNHELPPGDVAVFEAHLAGCAECQGTIAVTGAIFERLRAVPAAESSRDLVPAILARIRETPAAPRRSQWVAWAAAAAVVLLLGMATEFARRQSGNSASPEVAAAPHPDTPGGSGIATTLPPDAGGSVGRALDWFCQMQEADGSWSATRWGGEERFQPALTALPLLALLSEDRPTPEHTAAMARAAAALRQGQAENGAFGPAFFGASYNQSLATLALLRAYERQPDASAKPALDRALRVLIANQNASGGWGYLASPQPHPAITLWSVEALQLAVALGWDDLRTPLQQGRRWLAAQTSLDPAASADYFRAYFLARALRRGSDVASQQRLAALRDELRRQQVGDGSWSPNDQWGRAGGRLYATALASLALR